MPYADAVATLAHWHRESDQPPEQIILFPDPTEQVIRLVEVTSLVPETGEFYPIEFGGTPEIPFRTIVAQVSPDEWERIRKREMQLPSEWDLTSMEEVH